MGEWLRNFWEKLEILDRTYDGGSPATFYGG